MRNFEARKAEIMRRSAERMKKRKQIRNRILAACIPLAICAAVGAVAFFPASEPCEVQMQDTHINTAMGGPGGTNSNYSAVSSESLTVSAEVVVQVYSGDTLCTVAWDEDAERIIGLIGDICAAEKDMFADDSIRSETADQNTGVVCKVLLTDAEGNQTAYTWDGTVLCSADTGKTYALTEAQQKELSEALGFPKS